MKRVVMFFSILLVPAVSMGATIRYVGSDIDGGASEWRTASAAKPLDLDGDNIYGSYCAVEWGLHGSYAGETIGYAGDGWQYGGREGYAVIDLLTDPAVDRYPGIVGDFHTFLIGSEAPDVIRVGVMHDVLGADEFERDTPLVYTLSLDGDKSVTASVLTEQGNMIPDIYFFDIAGALAGQTYTVTFVDDPSDGGRELGHYASSFTWDVVPEPATLLLFGLGGIMISRRKHSV